MAVTLAGAVQQGIGDTRKHRGKRDEIDVTELVEDVPPDAGQVNLAGLFEQLGTGRGEHRHGAARVRLAPHPSRQACPSSLIMIRVTPLTDTPDASARSFMRIRPSGASRRVPQDHMVAEPEAARSRHIGGDHSRNGEHHPMNALYAAFSSSLARCMLLSLW